MPVLRRVAGVDGHRRAALVGEPPERNVLGARCSFLASRPQPPVANTSQGYDQGQSGRNHRSGWYGLLGKRRAQGHGESAVRFHQEVVNRVGQSNRHVGVRASQF